MTDITIRALAAGDEAGLAEMFAGLSAHDLTVIREDLSAPTAGIVDQPGLRWVAAADGAVLGYASLARLPGWSDHVGELRLVVGAARRGAGIGRRLVQEALRAGISAGLTKVMIELATDEDRVLTMFNELGFTGEALLRDHIRGRDGELRDLIVLAHHARDSAEAIGLVGVADDFDA
ncbi:GNAT family N-acetyltransferase [Tsukamurella sp. 1534]|uniref:GNAT family N-acetyltransferase n=1 Tax=Tsukamurella sp. 1534 TaxID=1151061 RepID=UPI00031C3FD1|nr:GNAT family N-acetyltransferase [Tsukamurella sp. 1534]